MWLPESFLLYLQCISHAIWTWFSLCKMISRMILKGGIFAERVTLIQSLPKQNYTKAYVQDL